MVVDKRTVLNENREHVHVRWTTKRGNEIDLIGQLNVVWLLGHSRGSASTPGKRRPDLDKFCFAQTDVLRPLKFAKSHRAGSVEELTVRVYCWRRNKVWQCVDGAVKTCSELSS